MLTRIGTVGEPRSLRFPTVCVKLVHSKAPMGSVGLKFSDLALVQVSQAMGRACLMARYSIVATLCCPKAGQK